MQVRRLSVPAGPDKPRRIPARGACALVREAQVQRELAGGVDLVICDAVRGEERAGELCLERADAGGALGVAAREVLVVRRAWGRRDRHGGGWITRGVVVRGGDTEPGVVAILVI